MQAAVADGQSKIVGILEVNWNINLKEKGERKKEIGGYENKKYLPLLELSHQADVDAYFWPQSQGAQGGKGVHQGVKEG